MVCIKSALWPETFNGRIEVVARCMCHIINVIFNRLCIHIHTIEEQLADHGRITQKLNLSIFPFAQLAGSESFTVPIPLHECREVKITAILPLITHMALHREQRDAIEIEDPDEACSVCGSRFGGRLYLISL